MRSSLVLSLSWGLLLSRAVVCRAEPARLIPLDFGECPSEVIPFLQHVVQERTAHGLNRVSAEAEDPANITIYGGNQEDANVAWIAAVAYKAPWSRFSGDADVRRRAFLLMDALTDVQEKGEWDDGGLRAYFFVHSFGWAALEWIESGDVDDERAGKWIDHLRLAADHAMERMHYMFLAGQYANPELYYMSGLAAAWKLTGEERYLKEAGLALRRYDDRLYEGGGVAYFLGSAPQHGYQHMVVKAVALYWDVTGDDYALAFLKRLSPHFPNVQHRSGMLTDAEQPQLKHGLGNQVRPGIEVMLACATGNGQNTRVAEVAARLCADTVNRRNPSFWDRARIKANWFNYSWTTFSAAALRILENHPLPDPVEIEHRRVLVDRCYRGVRSHWDDFTAVAGTRQRSDSLAGAYLADPSEPRLPLGAAVNGVHFEVLRNGRHFRSVGDQDPMAFFTHTDGFSAVGVHGRLFTPYWVDLPFLSHPRADVSDWHATQHWAVWRDCLIGLGALRYHGESGREGTARVRWPLAPLGRERDVRMLQDDRLTVNYGGLHVDLHRLAEAGGFTFAPDEIGEPPHEAWTPLLVRDGERPWSRGDFVHVATVVHPGDAAGEVYVKALPNGAAALMLEPGRRKAYVWVVNLTRHWQGYTLDLPDGVKCRTYKRDAELPPVPPGRPAYQGLPAVQNGLWALESETPISPEDILAGLQREHGRSLYGIVGQ